MFKKKYSKTEVEKERNGTTYCLFCRTEAVRNGFHWYCNCKYAKINKKRRKKNARNLVVDPN